MGKERNIHMGVVMAVGIATCELIHSTKDNTFYWAWDCHWYMVSSYTTCNEKGTSPGTGVSRNRAHTAGTYRARFAAMDLRRRHDTMCFEHRS